MGDWLLHNEIERQAVWSGDRIAFSFEDREYTYADFNARVNGLAHALREKGIERGDRIVTHSRNHVDLYTVFFACSKLGAIYSPISTFQSTVNTRYICERLDPRYVFYSNDEVIVDGDLPAVRETANGATHVSLDSTGVGDDVTLPRLLEGREERDPDWANAPRPDTPHNIFWTSGTTGRPKAALRDHRSTLHFADGFVNVFPVVEGDRRLIISNMMYIGPYYRDGIVTPRTGGTIFVAREYDAPTICELVRDLDINTVQIGFSLASALVEHVRESDDSVHIEYVHAVIESADIARGLYDLCDELYHIYGQTEAGHPLATRLEPPFNSNPSLGKPIPGSDVRVVTHDVERGELPTSPPTPGTRGELVVRSEGAMVRYLDDEPQQQNVSDGWVYTGDVVGVNEDGDLFFIDRIDDRIRSGGVNVYPSEIEAVLAAHPEIDDVIVVGSPDERWGERICALVVPRTPDVDAASLSGRLDRYCLDHEGVTRELRPRSYAFVRSKDDIPTGALNKTDRTRIVEKFFS